MTVSHLEMGVQPTIETSCISNIPQTMDNVQHNICIMNQPLSQRELSTDNCQQVVLCTFECQISCMNHGRPCQIPQSFIQVHCGVM